MAPLAAITLAQAGIGAIESVAGFIGEGKTNRQLAENQKIRPDYHIQKPILDNQAIAESRASLGLSESSINNYNTFTERNLTASLDAMTKGGGAMNNIGELFSSVDDGERKLALLDDEMNARNVQNLINQNKEMGGELDKEFQFNVYAPWADRQQALMAKLKKNQDMASNGINTVMSAASNYVMGKEYEAEGNSVYGKKSVDHMSSVNDAMNNLDKFLQPGSSNGGRDGAGGIGTRTSSIPEDLRIKFPGLIGSGYQIN